MAMKNEKGFTLIESLVAFAIATMVFAALSTVITTTYRYYTASNKIKALSDIQYQAVLNPKATSTVQLMTKKKQASTISILQPIHLNPMMMSLLLTSISPMIFLLQTKPHNNSPILSMTVSSLKIARMIKANGH